MRALDRMIFKQQNLAPMLFPPEDENTISDDLAAVCTLSNKKTGQRHAAIFQIK
jgi:hypothetical protein